MTPGTLCHQAYLLSSSDKEEKGLGSVAVIIPGDLQKPQPCKGSGQAPRPHPHHRDGREGDSLRQRASPVGPRLLALGPVRPSPGPTHVAGVHRGHSTRPSTQGLWAGCCAQVEKSHSKTDFSFTFYYLLLVFYIYYYYFLIFLIFIYL